MTNNKSTIEHMSLNKRQLKLIHEKLTYLLLAMALLVASALGSFLYLNYQQQLHASDIIDKQLRPLQSAYNHLQILNQFLFILDQVLLANSSQRAASLHKKLIHANNELTLLSSLHRPKYLDWLLKNKNYINLTRRLQNRTEQNNALTDSAIVHIQKIIVFSQPLDAQDPIADEQKNIMTIEQELTVILSELKQLNLKTPETVFSALKIKVDNVFHLARSIEEKDLSRNRLAWLNKRLLALKKLLLTENGVIAQWKKHAAVVQRYHRALEQQKRQAHQIRVELSQTNNVKSPVRAQADKQPIYLPQLIGATSLLLVCYLLWLIRLQVKQAWQKLLWQANKAMLTSAKESDIMPDCVESDHIIKLIKKVTSEYIHPTQYQELQGCYQKLMADKKRCETDLIELQRDSAERQYNVEQQMSSNLFAEQGLVKQLRHVMAKLFIQNASSSLITEENQRSHLNRTLYQLQVLDNELLHLQYAAYMQDENSDFSLTEVDLIEETYAVIFNDLAAIHRQGNEINLTISNQISARVQLNHKLFSQLLRVFIQLMFAELRSACLEITLQWQDKRPEQHSVIFIGTLNSQGCVLEPVKLVQMFAPFTERGPQQYLLNYFYQLLAHLHGEVIPPSPTKQGYQFSFTLPVTASPDSAKTANNTAVFELTGCSSFSLALHHLAKGNFQYKQFVTTNLVQRFYDVPIEVLLSIRSIQSQLPLILLLQCLGLQVKIVTQAQSQENHWKSGRYTMLITEFSQSPFIRLANSSSTHMTAPRAVISLTDLRHLPSDDDYFIHWQYAVLDKKTHMDQITTLLLPWLKEQPSVINNSTDTEHCTKLKTLQTAAFDFDAFAVHQGSVELAIYMLEDYIANNSEQFSLLSVAIASNNIPQAIAAIQTLQLNAKILAALDVVELCARWQQLLEQPEQTDYRRLSAVLLTSTKQKLSAVAAYAKTL